MIEMERVCQHFDSVGIGYRLVPLPDNRFPVACRPIHDLMPAVLTWCSADPVLRAGLRAAKYKATVGGDVLLTLAYGKMRELEPKEWVVAADKLRAGMLLWWEQQAGGRTSAAGRLVGVIGRTKGVRCVSGECTTVHAANIYCPPT